MNLIDAINEIGILETNLQLKKYENDKKLMNLVSEEIPISLYSLSVSMINEITIKILNLQKRNIMFLSNEISILENILKYKDYFDNLIVVLSNNMDIKLKENIIKNSPNSNIIKYINELEYPDIIKPKNSVLISIGYKNHNKCLLTKNSYRTLEIYKDFLGEKIFINCADKDIKKRPRNWISINYNKYFTKEI